jgi:uncharacterized membrane protein YjjB (DUF3815 family)
LSSICLSCFLFLFFFCTLFLIFTNNRGSMWSWSH